jgi:hypothetical protein
MANKIGFIVQDREVRDDGLSKVTIRVLNSDKPHLATNELPLILNALKGTHFLDPEIDNLGFTYTFPFELSMGWGFPYVFDFDIQDEILTLT